MTCDPEAQLMQLHWQKRGNFRVTIFVGQSGPIRSEEDYHGWIRPLLERRGRECPDGYTPMVCTQDSEHFALAAIR